MCGAEFDNELEAWQEPTGCRYIIGHPHTDNWFYCQKKIQKGGQLGNAVIPPYCDTHAELCVSPAFRMNRKILDKLCALDSNVLARSFDSDRHGAVEVDAWIAMTVFTLDKGLEQVKSQLNDMEFSSD
jgi:hypothetical protein